jgi:hypothetical protein
MDQTTHGVHHLHECLAGWDGCSKVLDPAACVPPYRLDFFTHGNDDSRTDGKPGAITKQARVFVPFLVFCLPAWKPWPLVVDKLCTDTQLAKMKDCIQGGMCGLCQFCYTRKVCFLFWASRLLSLVPCMELWSKVTEVHLTKGTKGDITWKFTNSRVLTNALPYKGQFKGIVSWRRYQGRGSIGCPWCTCIRVKDFFAGTCELNEGSASGLAEKRASGRHKFDLQRPQAKTCIRENFALAPPLAIWKN